MVSFVQIAIIVLNVCCVTVQAVTKMVQEAFSYIDKISNLDVKLKLIDTLRTVTAGKVSIHIIFLPPCLPKILSFYF